MKEPANLMNSSHYNRSIILITILISLLLFAWEEQLLYGDKVRDKLLGFNKAWQSNANSEYKIKAVYKPYVVDAYKDIQGYLGVSDEKNIKKWFGVFLEKLNNLDTQTDISDNIWSSDGYTTTWATSKDVSVVNKVNYNRGMILKGKSMSPPDLLSKRIFKEYVDYVKNSFSNITTKKPDKDPNKNFELYNNTALSNFFDGNLSDYEITSSYIKIHRFFIACVKDSLNAQIYSMAVYPAYADLSFSELNIPDRPWYKAAMTHKFPLHYRTHDENYDAEFGLTGLYNDVATATTTVLDRTFICSFKLPNLKSNVRFIACMDLFCDNSVDLDPPNPFTVSRNINLGYTSVSSRLFMRIPLGWCSVIDSIAFFLLIYLLMQNSRVKEIVVSVLEGILNQFNSYKYATFFLKKIKDIRLNENNVNDPPSIKFDNSTETIKASEFSNEDSFGISAVLKIFFLKFSKSRKKTQIKNLKMLFGDTSALTLGIDNKNYYRGVEYWEFYSRNTQSAIFIVKWLNSIFTKEELSIEILGEIKTKYHADQVNRILVYLKKEFENRLLTSENDYFEIRLELNQSQAVPVTIPEVFRKEMDGNPSILEYFTSIGRLHRFYEKKLFFRYRGPSKVEISYFLELYKDMDVYSVCGITFLQKLKNNDSLPVFLTDTNAPVERIFIETAEHQLYDFLLPFEDLVNKTYNDNETDKTFLVYVFKEEHAELIEKYKNYDFAIVKHTTGRTEYILYHTPNTTTSEIGWVSWRTIDIDFYQAVYKMLKIETNSNTVKIQSYMHDWKVNKHSKK